MSAEPPREPTEEELRAAYEEELKRIRVEHVLLENVISLINLGMRRAGVIAGTEAERDPAQVRLAIESVRAVMPLIEEIAPEQVGPIRQALSQLQLAFVQSGGQKPEQGTTVPEPAQADSSEPARPGEPGPAQRSGRLWIPGQ